MTTPTYIVPFEGFSYHPHQTEAIQFMIGRESPSAPYFRGGIEGDEMGLGKTYTTIGVLINNPVPKTLVLVPPMLQHQWAKALLESSIPHTILVGGKGPTKVAGTRDFSVTLSTYDRAINNIHILNETDYDRLVCDEGHVFKNGKATNRFRTLSGLRATRRWILTGTPVHNRKKDFTNLLMFLGNKTPITEASLSTVADRVMIRRVVKDVEEDVPTMPEAPTHFVHPVTMPAGSEELELFGGLVRRLEAAIEAESKQWIILELYLRIRQFIAHPAIYIEAMNRKYKGKYKRPTWTGTASKMTAFQTYMGTCEKRPTIVFTTFVEEMECADRVLLAQGYKTWQIRGGMTDATRAAVIEESKDAVEAGEDVVLLVQIVAGGCGLNLQHCSRVVMLTSHWNPAIVDQAIARAYRIGQTEHVEVHHFVLADEAELNIDRKIVGAHGRKRAEALEVHAKLFTESAIKYETMMEILDQCLEIDAAGSEDPVPVSTTAAATVAPTVPPMT
jgi:SNF2 family DNA or RNA helicase